MAEDSAASATTVYASLTVGEVSHGTALLSTEDDEVIRLPLTLLPPGIAVGHNVRLCTVRTPEKESQRDAEIRAIQAELRQRLGPADSVGSGAGDPLAS